MTSKFSENRPESLAVDEVYPPRPAHSRRDRLDAGAGQDEVAADHQLTVSSDDEVLCDTATHDRSVAHLVGPAVQGGLLVEAGRAALIDRFGVVCEALLAAMAMINQAAARAPGRMGMARSLMVGVRSGGLVLDGREARIVDIVAAELGAIFV